MKAFYCIFVSFLIEISFASELIDYSYKNIVDDSVANVSNKSSQPLLGIGDVIDEILSGNPQGLKQLSLKGNHISDDGALLLSEKLYPRLGALEVLDLSDNRISEKAMETLVPLLSKNHFKYLNITGNYGASIDGIKRLTLKLPRESIDHVVNNLKKVIWIKEDSIDTLVNALMLPLTYADAHRAYYQSLQNPLKTPSEKFQIRDFSSPLIQDELYRQIMNDLKSSIYQTRDFEALAQSAVKDPIKACKIGKEYMTGNNHLKTNYGKAVEWLMWSCSLGNIKALEPLDSIYKSHVLMLPENLMQEAHALVNKATNHV